jgi:hypothetical protein
MEFSIPQIKDGIALIPLLDSKYTAMVQEEIPNQVTLESKEFLNSAVFVDFNLVSIQDGLTDITIKIRRKKRSFDQYYELTNGFLHIGNLMEQLSKAIVLKAAEIEMLKANRV